MGSLRKPQNRPDFDDFELDRAFFDRFWTILVFKTLILFEYLAYNTQKGLKNPIFGHFSRFLDVSKKCKKVRFRDKKVEFQPC